MTLVRKYIIMRKYTWKKISRLAITVAMLATIKVQEPAVSYLELLATAPIAYAAAEKVVDIQEDKE